MKLTTKSYRRKLVTFGILLFAGISLTSTGFAAWVVSQGSQKEPEGNVEVGIVEAKSIDITDLTFYCDSSRQRVEGSEELGDIVPYTFENVQSGINELSYSFDASFGDNYGMIKYNGEPGAPFEALGMTVKGNITNAQSLDKLLISFELPKGIEACVEKGYIKVPEGTYYRGDKVLTKEIVTTPHETSPETMKSFSFDLNFEWGEAFLGVNPSLYFDKELSGLYESTDKTIPQTASFDEVSAILNELRGLVLGVESKAKVSFSSREYNVYDKKTLDEAKSEKFKLTIETIAK